MKRVIILLVLCLAFVGCSGGEPKVPTKPGNAQGVIILTYEKPVDFKHFEVFVSTVANFKPTGWDGKWLGQPNAPADWDGAANNLFMTATSDPIHVTGLTPGVTYYVNIVVVDKFNQRSDPSPEIEAVAGDAQRSSTVVVAASDASAESKVGADYICRGVSDQETINEAIAAARSANLGAVVTVIGTPGTYVINDSINLFSNVIFENFNIKIADGTAKQFYAIYAGDAIDDCSNIKIRNISIDGNGEHVADDIGGITVIEGKSLHLNNVKVANATGHGVDLVRCVNAVMDGQSEFSKIETIAILLDESENVKLSSCTVSDNLGIGVRVGGSTNCDMTGVTAKGNERGVVVAESNNCGLKNSRVFLNRKNGIELNLAHQIAIESCDIYANGQSANNQYSNIFIEYSDNCYIKNNTVNAGYYENKTAYGIIIVDADSADNVVTGNICYQSGVTAGIHNIGTNTNFGAGNRNNDGTWSTTPN